MKMRQAKKVLRSDKPQDVKRIIAAINRLGKTPTAIAQNLVKLGFEKGNQRDPWKCPVCLYLNKLGFSSPYVSVNDLRDSDPNRREFRYEWPEPMKEFQHMASEGKILCLGGYVEDDNE